MIRCNGCQTISGHEEGTFICRFCMNKIKAYNKYEKRFDEIVDENDHQMKRIEKLKDAIRRLVKKIKEAKK